MGLFVLPACIALIIKLYMLYSVYGNHQRQSVFLSMLAVFACHNICEILAYLYFFHGSLASWLVRSYYVISLTALLYMCSYAIEVSKFHLHRSFQISAVTVVLVLSLLILFSDQIISGSESMGYTLTATHGAFYLLFSFSVIGSMLFIGLILAQGYLTAEDSLRQIQCLYTLLALIPLLITGPTIIALQAFGWKINTAMVLPFSSTFFLLIVALSERSHKLTDIRTYLPFSTERRTTKKLLKLYSSYSTNNRTYKEVKEDCEKALVLYTLEKNKYNVSKSAEMMNVNRSTLYSMCTRLDIHIAAERN